jgi:hypothetical protein
MARLPHNQIYTRTFMLIQSADHLSGLTGASPTVKLSKAGGSGAAAGGSVTEVDSTNNPGLYKIAYTTTDTNTLGDLSVHVSAASADPTDFIDQVVAGIFKNVIYNNYEFLMTDSTNHNPATGKTVTVTRNIDGGAFGSGTLSAVTEVANGIYAVNFAAADLNGNTIMLRGTATGCDDVLERIITQ